MFEFMSESPTTDRIAFIGLGMMGYPLAGRLAGAGFPLAIFDLNSAALESFAGEFPCRICSTAIQAVADCEVVVTMLPTSNDVFAAVLGNDLSPGIVSVLKPGTVVIDMSSCDPLRTRELAAVLAERRITLVDAPVSGGVKKAREGSIAIMFGGSAETLERCRPMLAAMGSSIVHTGGVGSGHAMKALNNYVSAAGLVAVVEALRVGERFGLDPKIMTQVLNASSGKNNTTENKVAQYMLSGTFNSGFALSLMTKDIGIAMHLAEQLEIPTQLGHSCLDIWRAAAEKADRSADHTEMYKIGI